MYLLGYKSMSLHFDHKARLRFCVFLNKQFSFPDVCDGDTLDVCGVETANGI
jgi:hypothetical protein